MPDQPKHFHVAVLVRQPGRPPAVDSELITYNLRDVNRQVSAFNKHYQGHADIRVRHCRETHPGIEPGAGRIQIHIPPETEQF